MSDLNGEWSLVEQPLVGFEGRGIVYSFDGTHRPIDRSLWLAQRNLVERVAGRSFRHHQVAGPFLHEEHVNRLVSDVRREREWLVALGASEALALLDETVLFLMDIDCAPISGFAMSTAAIEASRGSLVGNAQRSNHIENGNHIYAAPSFLAVTIATLNAIGWPDATPNERSDCCEEWTWAAQELGIPVRLFKPISFEEAPPHGLWHLDDELGDFGIGTTFGTASGDAVNWHCFEVFRATEAYRSWVRSVVRGYKRGNARSYRKRVIGVDRTEFLRKRFEALSGTDDSPRV